MKIFSFHLLFICLNATLYLAVNAQRIASCRQNSDCAAPGCTCHANKCVNLREWHVNLAHCPICSSSAECTAPGDSCVILNLRKCKTCSTQAFLPAVDMCAAGSTATSSSSAKCVSTNFLLKHGLSHAAIRHFGDSDVLCIPGLPCASPGHLLRQCTTASGSCELISYQQVCRQRNDCTASRMPVSQVKHSSDWSKFRIISDHSSLTLTSLSAHHEASATSPSRIIANVTDFANQAGFGFFSDVIASLPYYMNRLRYIMDFRET